MTEYKGIEAKIKDWNLRIPLRLLSSLRGEFYEKKLLFLVRRMYESGEGPSIFQASIIIPTSKISEAEICEYYRTVVW